MLDVDDRLVADVDLVHPGRPVEREPVLGGPHDREHPAPAVGESAEGRPGLGAFGRRADRVRRYEANPAVDGVGDDAVAVEEALLVAS